jgi:hypothetical protein
VVPTDYCYVVLTAASSTSNTLDQRSDLPCQLDSGMSHEQHHKGLEDMSISHLAKSYVVGQGIKQESQEEKGPCKYLLPMCD